MVWENEPELFLHIPYYGSTIYTKRCLDMTTTIPLVANDFYDEFPVPPSNYQKDLVNSPWAQSDFQRLIDYISPNHYLVNCQGLVFLEVFPFDENEDIAASVPIYVRLFDVIDLTNFGFATRPNKVPPRTIKYFVDGYDALVEDPPVVIVTPDPPVIIVTPDPSDDDDDQADKDGGRPEFDPSWMTDNWESDWVDIYGLEKISVTLSHAFEVTRGGTNFSDDNTTNVGRNYFHGVRWFGVPDSAWPGTYMPIMVVANLGDKITQARFNRTIWGMFYNVNTWYPMRRTDGGPIGPTTDGPKWPP